MSASLIRLAHRLQRTLDQVRDQTLEFCARQLHVEVLGTGSISRDERQVDVGLRPRRQFALGFLRRLFETLQRNRVTCQVDALLFLELLDQPVDDALVEVVTTEMCVSVGRLDLDQAFADLEDGNVESTTTEVIDRDRLFAPSCPDRTPAMQPSAR